jgi:hypothetical protein
MRLIIEQGAKSHAKSAGKVHQRCQGWHQFASLDTTQQIGMALALSRQLFNGQFPHLAQLTHLGAEFVRSRHDLPPLATKGKRRKSGKTIETGLQISTTEPRRKGLTAL